MTKKYRPRDSSYDAAYYGDAEEGSVWWILVAIIILIAEALAFIPRKISQLFTQIRKKNQQK
jgi:hypothetical protein